MWAALDLGEEPEGLLYAVNREYAPADRELADGDVVALIPPVSGGAFVLSEEPLSLDRVVGEVATEEAGAIATFSGTARRHSRGRVVDYLDYEALRGDGRGDDGEARRRAPGALRPPRRSRSTTASAGSSSGEPSVVIAVSAAHRADALAACRDAIDILKTDVPLWKKEVYEGGEEWIGKGS